MSILSIQVAPLERGVKVEQSNSSVKVSPSETGVKVSSSVTRPSGLRNSLELDGTDFDGSSGGSNRSYTHTTGFPTNAKVYIGSAPQGLQRLTSNEWSLTTTTVADDTITLSVTLYDEDQVVIDL